MFKKQKAQITIQDLQLEINSIRQEIKEIKNDSQIAHEQFRQEIFALKLENNPKKQTPIISEIEDKLQGDDEIEFLPKSNSTDLFINLIDRVIFQKWYTEIQIVVDKEYYFTIVALLDSGADSNCIQEELISAKYYEKTTEGLFQASGTSLNIEFRLPNAHVHKDGIYIQPTFVLVKNITNKVILGNLFITLLYPIKEISEKRSHYTNFRSRSYFSFCIATNDKRHKFAKRNFIFKRIKFNLKNTSTNFTNCSFFSTKFKVII